MFKVIVDGFKTKELALEFVRWYEGQGEQNCAIWFECQDKDDNACMTNIKFRGNTGFGYDEFSDGYKIFVKG